MPIRLLLEEDHAFSPDDVKILIDAFEDTLRALGLTDPEHPSSIKIAKIVIGLAKDGERDPARLTKTMTNMNGRTNQRSLGNPTNSGLAGYARLHPNAM